MSLFPIQTGLKAFILKTNIKKISAAQWLKNRPTKLMFWKLKTYIHNGISPWYFFDFVFLD